MEMNKDEAERCLELGRKFLRDGSYAKAIKFLDKSLKLYPLPGVEALKARAESEWERSTGSTSRNGGGSNSANADGGAGQLPRRRAPGGGGEGGGGGSKAGQNGRSYSEEQVVACRTIIQSKKKGHYEVLSVSRTATDDQIKKSYRKLALKFHPDKNAAPQADEAFKAISTAFQVLSDPDKRRSYDQFGDDDGTEGMGGQAHPFRHADVSPEEIFNMFFGVNGGGRPANFRVYRSHHDQRNPFFRYQQQQQHRQGQAQPPLGALPQVLQLLPVLLLLFLSLFSFPQESERAFSLHRTDRHPLQRSTSMEHILPNIPYFVGQSFGRDYARDRRRLFQVEREVQQSYLYDLQRQCEGQKQNKVRRVQAARRLFNAEERAKRMAEADALPLEACRLFQEATRLL
ncbi:dnaj subfamily b member 12 [Nannochloropsis gaditana]|uniref:Dnaj subfamily b member 12 n=1 Tax=Nannochloropsis gaditana TaxID=72520 RepID=W7TVZ4_9STRA|nr:dnaj subfamily b member 12 [Nannochloropsis gaditana]